MYMLLVASPSLQIVHCFKQTNLNFLYPSSLLSPSPPFVVLRLCKYALQYKLIRLLPYIFINLVKCTWLTLLINILLKFSCLNGDICQFLSDQSFLRARPISPSKKRMNIKYYDSGMLNNVTL